MKNETKYVIAIKRVRNYIGRPLSENEQYFEYLSTDDGPHGSGDLCFSDLNNAYMMKFSTDQEAIDYYNAYVQDHINVTLNDYDTESIIVRKLEPKTMCSLPRLRTYYLRYCWKE